MVTSLSLKFKNRFDPELNSFQEKGCKTLHNAYQEMSGDPPSKIPFLVWFLENPDSPLPFSGKIDLYRHDCLHLLLERGFSLEDEAFVVGFTMGNDPRTRWFHVALFKLISTIFYPKDFRFNQQHLIAFDLGLWYGRKIRIKNINRLNLQVYKNQSIADIRQELGIHADAVKIMWQAQNLLI
jgi:hypothetical protein